MAQTTSTSRDSTTLLADPRYELLPFKSFSDQVTELPEGSRVAITASPNLGIDRTVEATKEAEELGYEAVPHVAARYVRGDDHLEEIVAQIADAGVTDIFVPGGDPEDPAGDYESAYDLLEGLERIGYDDEFDEVGITGYPEGHAFISDAELVDAMEKKAPYATYIATQLCFDPNAILEWIEEIRARGVDLPVVVGIPGVMKYQRLLSISKEVGVGDSIRYLQKTNGIIGFIRQLIGSRGYYKPDDLVDGLQAHATDADYAIADLQISTFNQVPDTEEWRRSRLDG